MLQAVDRAASARFTLKHWGVYGTLPAHRLTVFTNVSRLIQRDVDVRRPEGGRSLFFASRAWLRPCPWEGASRGAGVGRVRSMEFLK